MNLNYINSEKFRTERMFNQVESCIYFCSHMCYVWKCSNISHGLTQQQKPHTKSLSSGFKSLFPCPFSVVLGTMHSRHPLYIELDPQPCFCFSLRWILRRVLLSGLGQPWTHSTAQAGVKFNTPASASTVAGTVGGALRPRWLTHEDSGPFHMDTIKLQLCNL